MRHSFPPSVHRAIALGHTLAAIALIGLAGTPGQAAAGAGLSLTPCMLTASDGVRHASARCGALTVPENPADPQGVRIDLHVAVIPALSPNPAADAITVIAGGPGAASTRFYVDIAPTLSTLRRERDVMLVDQRGTGQSNPLDCAEIPDEAAADFSPAAAREAAADCLAALAGDPRYYTTIVAVQDLERVRAALGYEQLNIYGASYGTRVALHYLRTFPERTRSVVLDGVVPPDLHLGLNTSTDAQAALDRVFERCAKDRQCAARFPDLAGAFAGLRARLATGPMLIDLPDPVTGRPTTATFGASQLAVAVRLLSYRAETVSLLPLLIHDAWSGNPAPLAAQALMISERLSSLLSYGMHNAIVCTEDAPYYADLADVHAMRRTYLGELQYTALREMCSIWPAGVIDGNFKTPVTSDQPVLILSGMADPVTPPRNGDHVYRTLANAVHVKGPDQGHGLLTTLCGTRMVTEFVQRANPHELEHCEDALGATPFFLDPSGPGP